MKKTKSIKQIIEIQYFENIEPNIITYYKKLY